MRLAPSKQSRGLKQERRIKEKIGSRFFEATTLSKVSSYTLSWAEAKIGEKYRDIFGMQLSVLQVIDRVWGICTLVNSYLLQVIYGV